MRIAFFVDSYKPDLSGLVVSVDTFATELRALGHKVFIFAPRMGEAHSREKGVVRIDSLRVPFKGIRNYHLMRPSLGPQRRHFADFRPDIVHTHTPFTAGISGDLFAKRYGIPHITTYHTLITEYCHYVPLPQRPLRKAAAQTSRWFCNRADGVVAPSASIETLLREYGVRRPIRVIPTGIDPDEYPLADRGASRARLGIPPEAVVLAYVGRVAREKNLPFLLEAWRRIFNEDRYAMGLLVGGGPDLDAIRSYATELGIADRIHFAGMVRKTDVPSYYAAADIFTFASVTETQGLVVAEAMASGLPAVLVNAMGVAGMVRDQVDGFLCPVDGDIFADRVRRLIHEQELRSKMGEQARDRAAEYSSQRMAERLMDFYREILHDWHPHRHRFSSRSFGS